MSRIGRQPISIPPDVNIELANQQLICRGPKGELSRPMPSDLKIELQSNHLVVIAPTLTNHKIKARHGLIRSLIANMIKGVSDGFEKTLELKGVGYQAIVDGQSVKLLLGYSHPVVIQIQPGIQIKVEKGNVIKVAGVDKELVGNVAATIRRLRPVEPYKGRGIRYSGETVKKKVGKTSKTGSA